MRSREYWEKRAAQRMVNYQADAERTANEIGEAYFEVQKHLQAEAAKVFRNFQKDFDLSDADARRYLETVTDESAYIQLRKAVQKMPDGDEKRAALTVLSSPAYQYRINRLDAVRENIARTCKELYKTELRTDTAFLDGEAKKAYLNTIYDIQRGTGVSGAFDLIPQSRIDQILKRPWCGDNYSVRIWKNTQGMADDLKQDLLQGFLAGKSEQEMVEAIADRCSTSFFNARRLVRTETSYISCQAELEGFKEAGVDKYEFSAILDDGTSEICRSLDGKIFPVAEAQPGANYPPMHPWCRSTPVPVLPDEEELDRRWNQSADKLGLDLPFDEWVKHLEQTPDGKMIYVKTLDKSGASDIINLNSNNIGENSKITDSGIENVPFVELDCLDAENSRKFQQANKDILTEAAKHKIGTEVSAIYRLSDMSQIGETIIGEEGAGTVKLAKAEEKFIGLHNHPDGSTISLTDFETFCGNSNMAAISATTNDGHIHVLEISQDPNKYVDVVGYLDYVYDAMDNIRVMGYSLDDYKNDLIDFTKIDKNEFCSQVNDKIIAIWKAGADYGFRYHYK